MARKRTLAITLSVFISVVGLTTGVFAESAADTCAASCDQALTQCKEQAVDDAAKMNICQTVYDQCSAACQSVNDAMKSLENQGINH
ncbi:MAG: hypothetical protein OEM02_13310 [Desulfobulbaceae bacterium]|nr:hypothetical protein [Desulfobulbaceae bacterium]